VVASRLFSNDYFELNDFLRLQLGDARTQQNKLKRGLLLSCDDCQFKQVLRRIYDSYFSSKFRAVVLRIYQHYSLTNIQTNIPLHKISTDAWFSRNTTPCACRQNYNRLKHYQVTVWDLGNDGRTIQRHGFIWQTASLFPQDIFFFVTAGIAAIPATPICCQLRSTHFSSML
jgi:hypothetical protein